MIYLGSSKCDILYIYAKIIKKSFLCFTVIKFDIFFFIALLGANSNGGGGGVGNQQQLQQLLQAHPTINAQLNPLLQALANQASRGGTGKLKNMYLKKQPNIPTKN